VKVFSARLRNIRGGQDASHFCPDRRRGSRVLHHGAAAAAGSDPATGSGISEIGHIVHLSPGCELIGTGNYTLVSRQPGGMGMCQGDIEQVVDFPTHTQAGSCTVVDVVPYYRR
jgi:hypothetical protein